MAVHAIPRYGCWAKGKFFAQLRVFIFIFYFYLFILPCLPSCVVPRLLVGRYGYCVEKPSEKEADAGPDVYVEAHRRQASFGWSGHGQLTRYDAPR